METKEDILILYNPLVNKAPVGACKCEENITMEVVFPSHFNIYNLRLIIMDDNNNLFLSIPFTKTTSFKIKEKGIYWYFFEFDDCYGHHYIVPNDGLYGVISNSISSKWNLSIYEDTFESVKWFNGGIMYQIMPDRFNRVGNTFNKEYAIFHKDWNEEVVVGPINGIWNIDFFGGNLRGIIEKLPYLKSLNVNVIYLNPIFLSGSNHRYDTSDYMMIDPVLGSEEDFKELITKANKKGIKIILDMVFNHTGDDSIYFNKYHHFNSVGAIDGAKSQYYDWYDFGQHYKWGYRCWWDVATLPSLNQHSKSYISFIKSVLNKWISLGASGVRLDVVDELNDNSVMAIRDAVKKANPNAIVIGEVWENAADKIAYDERRHYFNGLELDSVMNYCFMKAIINYLKNNDYNSLSNTVRMILNDYPKCVVDNLMNIVDTHDTFRIINNFYNDIPLTLATKANYKPTKQEQKNASLKMMQAVVLQFTLPGVPCIYYGDEAGLDGFDDPFCRRPYPWDNVDNNMLAFYSTLTKIRKDKVFETGSYKEYKVNDKVFSFLRCGKRYSILVCINNSDTKQKLNIDGLDLINESIVNECCVNPHSFGIFKVNKNA